MKTLISKVGLTVDILIVVLLLMIVYFVFNLKLLYTMIAPSWIPSKVLNPSYSTKAENIKRKIVKRNFKSHQLNGYVFEPDNFKDQLSIIWFTGQYFISTYVNENYFQLICEKTKRRVVVFEYPTIRQGKIDEIMDYIEQLLYDIIKHYKIKSVCIGGDNSGCFYALIYADFIKNLLNQTATKLLVDIDIKECVFIDGIYNISSLPIKFHQLIIGAAVTEISSNANSATITTYQHITNVTTRVIPIMMHIMSSKDEFHAAINKSYVQQDTVNRTLYEIAEGKDKFFYFLESNLPLVASWFQDA